MSSDDVIPPTASPSATPRGQLFHWKRMQRVLVATDGSLTAADAIAFAVEFASTRDAELVVVHVAPTVEFLRTTGIDAGPAAVSHEPTTQDHALLREAAALAAEHGVQATTALRDGSIADEIVAHAELCDVDLIVLGSRGHGAVANALLGSVAVGVLHAAKQPVIVIRCATPTASA
jgi:nucleotide-binding universal stress UspA family protein